MVIRTRLPRQKKLSLSEKLEKMEKGFKRWQNMQNEYLRLYEPQFTVVLVDKRMRKHRKK
jgi:hypothetical protein